MKINQLHDWNISPKKAKAIQTSLLPWVMLEDQKVLMDDLLRIHISLNKGKFVSVKCQHIARNGEMLNEVEVKGLPNFPMIKGLLSFAVTPFVIQAITEIDATPGLIICDGRGIRPEGGFGVASHVGLLTNVPTVGVKATQLKKHPHIIDSVPEMGDWVENVVNETVVSGTLNAGKRLPLLDIYAGHQISVSSAVTVLAGLLGTNVNEKVMRAVCGPFLRIEDEPLLTSNFEMAFQG